MRRREHADRIREWARDVSEHAEALRDGALTMGATPPEALPDPSTLTGEQLLGAMEGVLGYLAPHVAPVIELAGALLRIAEEALVFAAQIESGETGA